MLKFSQETLKRFVIARKNQKDASSTQFLLQAVQKSGESKSLVTVRKKITVIYCPNIVVIAVITQPKA